MSHFVYNDETRHLMQYYKLYINKKGPVLSSATQRTVKPFERLFVFAALMLPLLKFKLYELVLVTVLLQ
jgi:hypothetical protein